MIELTDEQRECMTRTTESPPRVVDPETDTHYVLVREEIYLRLQRLFDGDDSFTADLVPHVMRAFGRDGWDDPAMDVYNDLDPRQQP